MRISLATRRLELPDPTKTIFIDSSGFAWGASCDEQDTGGPWVLDERDWHINRKELWAAFFGLKAFATHLSDCHVQLRVDNTTAVAYINNQGGKNWDSNEMARELWLWASARGIWVTAVHIPGMQNVKADAASRKAYATDKEWKLDDKVFWDINQHFGPFSVDLFASQTNAQCDQYVSWKPNPFAMHVDAFSMTWANPGLYAFPPFSVIGPVLTKVVWEKASLLIVLPLRPSQH